MKQDEGEREREARAALRRVEADSGSIFSSAVARATNHLAAREADPGDAVEVWGRRVGRVLSVIGFIVLSYLLGEQLRLW
jgi:hypothetical protein